MTHTGSWAKYWDNPIPAPVSVDQLDKTYNDFTLDDVMSWIEDHNNIEGRFRFFDVYNPNSAFYCRVARPLISMHTTGSIDVERVAKPFKHNLLWKERNCLSDENGIVLFRSAQNLRYLMKANMALKGQVYDVLVQGGHSGYDVDPVMEEIDAE